MMGTRKRTSRVRKTLPSLDQATDQHAREETRCLEQRKNSGRRRISANGKKRRKFPAVRPATAKPNPAATTTNQPTGEIYKARKLPG